MPDALSNGIGCTGSAVRTDGVAAPCSDYCVARLHALDPLGAYSTYQVVCIPIAFRTLADLCIVMVDGFRLPLTEIQQ